MTDLGQLKATVVQLREDVDYLMAVVETGSHDGIATVPGSAGPNSPGSAPQLAANVWHTLTSTEAANAWTALTNWVDWLTGRYQLGDTIPDCWYQHGAMVEELEALRSAWVGAYVDPTAGSADPAQWHDFLSRTTNRIHEWDRYGCAAGTHHDDARREPDEALRFAREEHVYLDVHRRGPTPEPTDLTT